MIIKRKIYSSPSSITTGGTNSSASEPSGGVSIESTGSLKQAPNMSVSRTSAYQSLNAGSLRPELAKINMIEKSLKTGMYSDSPAGISYVSGAKSKRRRRGSLIAKGIRTGTNPLLKGSKKVLQDLPMSDESKIKQGKKLNAIKFYLDRSTRGLDKVAEKVYSEDRMPVSAADMRKAETDGVVQRRPDGKWGIIAKRKRLWWSAGYDSRESAEAALRAYHAGRH